MARRLLFILTLFMIDALRSEAFSVTNGRSFSNTQRSSLFTISQPTCDVETAHYDLATGVSMLVESSKPNQSTDKPPLLFLHGSFHGSWCWSEHFFSFFVERGFPVAALNWRGTGGTKTGNGVKKVKINEHVADFTAFLDDVVPQLGHNQNVKPIVVCHSFGGLAIMKYLESNPEYASQFSGIVMICSVPPSGNGKMTMRYLKRSLRDSWKITMGFAMKKVLTHTILCRELFFGGETTTRNDGSIEDHGITDADVLRYQRYFTRDSEATIDLIDLAKQLPSLTTTKEGRALFANDLPPCLVIGSSYDMVVDVEGVEETATYFGLDAWTTVDSPHDVMLGAKWRNGAEALNQWIEKFVL